MKLKVCRAPSAERCWAGAGVVTRFPVRRVRIRRGAVFIDERSVRLAWLRERWAVEWSRLRAKDG
jgi:hypothetical protein